MTAPARRTVRLLAGDVLVGQLAATTVPHPFVPDGHTGTSCMACYGWVCDPRHLGKPALAVTP